MAFQINSLDPTDVPLGPGAKLILPDSSGLDGPREPGRGRGQARI